MPERKDKQNGTTDLLDVNLWLALADGNHVHHARAVAYWMHESAEEMAFCRVTMLGFLRLSTHPKVLSRPLSAEEAWSQYRQYRVEDGICWIEDSESLDADFVQVADRVALPQHLWTDAYLAALSVCRGCRIVSFDEDFRRFPGVDFLHLT